MVENKQTMARNIQKYMDLNNVKATDVCKALGFKQNTFSDWVNAKTYPRIDAIEKLARYFRISKSELVEEHDEISQAYELKIGSANVVIEFLKTSKSDFTDRVDSYMKHFKTTSVQELLKASYGCTDEQIQIATNVLNSYKPGNNSPKQ